MLEIKNIAVSYGKICAIRDLSFRVQKGEIVALIGANGAGKTTTLKTISGLLRVKSGSIVLEGQEISKMKAYLIAQRGIAHVPERRGIFANLTVFENLLMGAYGKKVRLKDFDEVFDLFPVLGNRKKQLGGTLSGGEQQMLAISRALVAKPHLMILDEPSLGLAPQITKSIMETIKRINETGTTILLVEQNAKAALKIAHRGYVLEVGDIICEDKAQALLNNETVKKAYLGEH